MLVPPDVKQCQAEKPNGYTFMTLGGRPRLERCKNTPTWVVTENQPGPDGLIGSMSVCDDCLRELVKQLGPDYVNMVPVEDYEIETMITRVKEAWTLNGGLYGEVVVLLSRIGERIKELRDEQNRLDAIIKSQLHIQLPNEGYNHGA